MTGHTYLLKSRHGVYYLRVVLPECKARLFGRRAGELRLSLRTKSKEQAKLRLAEKLHTMIKDTDLMPWEAEADRLRASYERGLALVEQFGRLNPHDVHRIDAVREALSDREFRDLVYVNEYEAQVRNAELQSAPAISPPTIVLSANEGTSSTRDDLSIASAIERFVNSKKTDTRAATADKYGAQCRLFLKMVCDGQPSMRISELRVQHLRDYVDMLPKLPKKIMPDDQRTIAELVERAGPSTMAPKTRFSHAQAVNMFLTWANEQAYPVPSAFEGILKPLLKKPKGRNLEKHFTADELKMIFSSAHYHQGLFKRPIDYWVPLLGLFTGAREAELCQLHHQDIYRDEQTRLWVISLNENDDKRLKTRSSVRIVPIHPQLIDLGLLEYLNRARTFSNTHVFASDKRTPRGEFGAFSKRFNRFKVDLGIRSLPNATKKDFHSFRHSLSGNLLSKGAASHVVDSITGHTPAGQSMSVSTYSGEGVSLTTKAETLSRLEWNIDFTQIKPNGWNLPLGL